jgi:hypothetical protein
MVPDKIVRVRYPLPEPSALRDEIDERRVRAHAVDSLEQAALEGNTVQSRDRLVNWIRDSEIKPQCPVSLDVLDTVEDSLGPIIWTVPIGSDQRGGYQLDRFAQTKSIICQAVVDRVRGKRHAGSHSWRDLIDNEFGPMEKISEEERSSERAAREEKAAALEQLFRARVSVLVGAAGTGKTSLLKIFCGIDEIFKGGILLLAPTGKARVRLETATGRSGAKTIAQLLRPLGRYDDRTGHYFVTKSARKSPGHKTVIIDECSMVTEEQLAALLDAVAGIERLVLVGDTRQLPPIGAGRPFVDIVRRLSPKDVESLFPKAGPNYAELSISRRQLGEDRDDMRLAQCFAGRPGDPGSDEIWGREDNSDSTHLKLVSWRTSEELQQRLTSSVVSDVGLAGPEDENGFESSLGGAPYGSAVYFWERRNERPGAAEKAESWQILSPVRPTQHGVDALNRLIHEQFRSRAFEWSDPEKYWNRRVAKPCGPQKILYGDKVINLKNGVRFDVRPKPEAGDSAYFADGDVGIVVGQYKGKKWPFRNKLPWKLEVEFVTHLGSKVGYYSGEFGDDGSGVPLELAYALTVHKTQGSQFERSFVILPNPCSLLSRELLYTALTRHKEKLTVLHQGDLGDLRKYSSELYSDVAQRMTNLFDKPFPIEITLDPLKGRKAFFESGLIHRTERGDLVRSKSELNIADKLLANGVDYYEYERPFRFGDGYDRYPDFTVRNEARGITFYWEHLGLLSDDEYTKRWKKKLTGYRAMGVLPYQEGEGANGVLIVTKDEPNGALDSSQIARIIRDVILA